VIKAAPFSILPAAAVEPSAWDELVASSPEGWAWALSGWQRLILRVNEWALVDFSFAIAEAGRLVGVMPLQYQPAARRMGASGWGPVGPIVTAALSGEARQSAVAAMIAEAERSASACGALTLDFGRVGATATAAEAGHNPFVALGFDDLSTVSKVVRLDAEEPELWRGLSKNARQMVKKATRLGYTVRAVDWRACVDDYYRVHTETYTRTGVSPHPRAYFEGIASEMAPGGHAVLFAGCASAGHAVAFHNDAYFGPGALYHTGCSETAHLDSGINYLLMWQALCAAKRAGRRWYEIGEVFPDEMTGKTHGLTVFKSKFGGELRPFLKVRKQIRAAATLEVQPADSTPDARVRAAYDKGAIYAPSRICREPDSADDDYVDRLLRDKLALVSESYRSGRLVDLCCGAGAHVLNLADGVRFAVGIDFTERYLEAARIEMKQRGRRNVAFLQADARQVPLADASVDLLYSFSALYAIPRPEEMVREIGRVLAPGGRAVLDFGNRRSLNVFCLRYYPEWPPIQPLSLAEIRRALAAAGLVIVRHRRFQVLPLWAGRPRWLSPLLHPIWKRILKRRVNGRMLDEWLSSLPVLRAFAFRHLVVCERRA
jgi:ubiquinone/menaquinone biosynthesis C-methylase UbiE